MLLRRSIPALLVLLGVIYAAYWFVAASQMNKAVIAWSEARRAEGWQVNYTDLTTTGFPGRMVLHAAKPEIITESAIAWRGESVTVSLSPLNLHTLHISAPGHHEIGIGEGHLDGNFAGLDATIGFTGDGHLGDFQATAHSVTFGALTAESLVVSLTPLSPPQPITHASPTVGFSVTATEIGVPELPGQVLERHVKLAEFTGRLLGAVPLQSSPRNAITAWSTDGGTIAIDRLALEWEPMAVDGDGTIAFDAQMQPLAAFSARVRGYDQMMNRIVAAGMIQPGPATAGRMLMSLMAKPDAQGRSAIPLPITVQEGGIWLGPSKVAELPAVTWFDKISQ